MRIVLDFLGDHKSILWCVLLGNVFALLMLTLFYATLLSWIDWLLSGAVTQKARHENPVLSLYFVAVEKSYGKQWMRALSIFWSVVLTALSGLGIWFF